MERKLGPGQSPKIEISPSKQHRLQPQKLIAHKLHKFQQDYVIVGKVGEGSFGQVYKVKHKLLELERALKIIKKNSTNSHSTKQQIQVLMKLDHPNILKLYEFYQNTEFYYIVTELFQGRELFDQIIDQNPFTQEKAAVITREILKALVYTHKQKLVHRDIKAENVLIKKQDNQYLIKIIDWGLGTVLSNQHLIRRCGTPQYAAPQVFEGKYNQKCDLWSLGVILYIMLIGQMPFKGKNTSETIALVQKANFSLTSKIWKKVSIQARDLVKKLLAKDPAYRLSAQTAIQHNWIKLHTKSTKQPLQLRQTLQRLKQFHVENNIHVAAINYINNHLSTQQQRKRLNDIFLFLDKNGDGVLELNELIEGYSVLYGTNLAKKIAQQIFLKLDLNKSGSLEYNEFITYAMMRKKEIPENKLRQAFKLFDINQDGKISCQEVKNILCNEFEDIDEKQWEQLTKDIDENGDGLIDQNQFFKFMSNISLFCEKNKTMIIENQSENQGFKDHKNITNQQKQEKSEVVTIQKQQSLISTQKNNNQQYQQQKSNTSKKELLDRKNSKSKKHKTPIAKHKT